MVFNKTVQIYSYAVIVYDIILKIIILWVLSKTMNDKTLSLVLLNHANLGENCFFKWENAMSVKRPYEKSFLFFAGVYNDSYQIELIEQNQYHTIFMLLKFENCKYNIAYNSIIYLSHSVLINT